MLDMHPHEQGGWPWSCSHLLAQHCNSGDRRLPGVSGYQPNWYIQRDRAESDEDKMTHSAVLWPTHNTESEKKAVSKRGSQD